MDQPTRPPFDPAIHEVNAHGRVVSKATKKMAAVDPATVPKPTPTATATPAPTGATADLEGVGLPPVPPESDRGAPEAFRADSSSEQRPPQGSSSQGPSAHSSSGSQPPSGSGSTSTTSAPWSEPPSIDDDAALAGPPKPNPKDPNTWDRSQAHDPDCWRGQAEGLACRCCGQSYYPKPPRHELAVYVRMHEQMVNRFSPYPRPFTDDERADSTEAMELLAVRYGNPLVEYMPIFAIVGATMMPMRSRRTRPQPLRVVVTKPDETDPSSTSPAEVVT